MTPKRLRWIAVAFSVLSGVLIVPIARDIGVLAITIYTASVFASIVSSAGVLLIEKSREDADQRALYAHLERAHRAKDTITFTPHGDHWIITVKEATR